MTLTPDDRRSVVAIRLQNARDALADAKILIDSGSKRGAANRIYYAAFHAVSALAVAKGETIKTHRGVIAFFHRSCVRSGATEERLGIILQKAFEDRSEADYDDDISLDHDQLNARLSEVIEFVDHIRDLIDGLEKNSVEA